MRLLPEATLSAAQDRFCSPIPFNVWTNFLSLGLRVSDHGCAPESDHRQQNQRKCREESARVATNLQADGDDEGTHGTARGSRLAVAAAGGHDSAHAARRSKLDDTREVTEWRLASVVTNARRSS
jgi:hypothetical protein